MPDPSRIYDISPLISERTAVFPGDTRFSRQGILSFEKGSTYALSSLTTTPHIGAHADAPAHYHPKGEAIAERPLDRYLGSCQIMTVKIKRGERIRPSDLHAAVQAPRVLFKTGSFPNPERWNEDFNSLSAELIESLAQQGVRLVGIDTPSIDLANDKILESHNAVFKHDLAVLEGLVLEAVEDGLYQLSALPLKIDGADASPVRAVLWKP